MGWPRRIADGGWWACEALVHVIQLKADVIEALGKLIKILVPMVVENLKLYLKLLGCIIF